MTDVIRTADEKLIMLRDCWACGTGMDFDQKPPKCLACGADDPCGNGPTKSIAEPLYYLQTRGYVGNSLMWWKKGKHGYTTDVRRAHVFTREEAYGQAKVRPTEDFPWRKDYIDANVEHSVNAEVVKRDHVGAV